MLMALLWGATGAGTLWIVTQAIGLYRQHAVLRHVRAVCASPGMRGATADSFQERWTATWGERRGTGWATDRVYDLLRLRAGGFETVAALSRLDQDRANRSLAPVRLFAGTVLFVG